jgi:hypothetical protein
MSTLYVTEYSGPSRGGQIQTVHGRRLRKNNVAIGASSAASNAFGDGCGVVRVATDANCSFVFSSDDGVVPTATNADQYLAAGGVEYFTTKPGDFIAVIQNP